MSDSEEPSPYETFFNFKIVEGVQFKVIICKDLFDWMNGKTFHQVAFNFITSGPSKLTETEWSSNHTDVNTEQGNNASLTWKCRKETFEKVKKALNTANKEWARKTKRQFWHDFSEVEDIDLYVIESSQEIKDLQESYSEEEIKAIQKSIQISIQSVQQLIQIK